MNQNYLDYLPRLSDDDDAVRLVRVHGRDSAAAGVALAALFSPIAHKLGAGRWFAVMANARGELFEDLYGAFMVSMPSCGQYKTRAACIAAIESGGIVSAGVARHYVAACISICEDIWELMNR